MGAMQHRLKRALARAGHFVPHLFIAVEVALLGWKLATLARPSMIEVMFDSTPGGTGAWGALLVAVGLVVFSIPIAITYALHDRYCTICVRYRAQPRYSRILMGIGRPWWTVQGAQWPGLFVALGILVGGLWFNWALLVHYVLMIGYWLGFIGYMRLGSGRAVTV
jgi:hypothetical protein